ncbi:MAG TPA: O-antigen ligase family protein [Solirubrobacterales bacterium]|nr:O-antigen ligase family protein [Solirubrobacterales bacterium]
MRPESSATLDPASQTREPAHRPGFDWSALWPWGLGFAVVAYLGLEGGGFDPLVGNQVGIAAWWVLLFAVAVAVLPRLRVSRNAWVAIGLLLGFLAWTALSLSWTESVEKTAADLARVATFLGIFVLALFSSGGRNGSRLLAAVAAAIALVGVVGLLSRLHPAWFPAADQTAQFLTSGEERLSYPVNYWNGLAALIGVGLPLLLHLAAGARTVWARALAAAAMPALILASYFTLSRGGIAGAALALAIYLVFAANRLPKAITLALALLGGGFLVLLAHGRDALVHGNASATAHSQGNEMIFLTLVVCLAVGAAQAGWTAALASSGRPLWRGVSPRQAWVATGVAILVAIVALLAVGAPSRVSNAWSDFKAPSSEAETGTERLSSFAGESRYQFWSSAVREMKNKPLTGTGSGTFQLWWTRDGDTDEPVIDTHNLYLQTAGELGLVGLALLLAFTGLNLIGGAAAALRAVAERRSLLAAALAGTTVLWTTSLFDWMWKLPVIPIAVLLLVAVLFSSDPADDDADAREGFALPLRIGTIVLSLLALAAIAIPLTSTTFLRRSQDEARAGNVAAALDDARTAQNALPGAAGPWLQEGLLLESAGQLDGAAAATREATDKEPNEWRNWLVLSRIEAERGRSAGAIAAYRQARSLNPRNPVFRPRG